MIRAQLRPLTYIPVFPGGLPASERKGVDLSRSRFEVRQTRTGVFREEAHSTGCISGVNRKSHVIQGVYLQVFRWPSLGGVEKNP